MLPVVSYCERWPPLAAFVTAKCRNVRLELVAMKKDMEPKLTLPSGDVLLGQVMLKYLAAIGDGVPLLPIADPLLMARLDQWLDFISLCKKGYDIAEFCKRVDEYLSLRTYILGHSLTLADIALWAQLRNSKTNLKLFDHLRRWWSVISDVPQVKEVDEERTAELSKAKMTNSVVKNPETYKIDLPNAKIGSVVTRFPPEPSGYLHIGHAKAALLNYHIAKQYKGKLIVRFDDTNPAKEKDEFVENILKDLADLGVHGDRLTYTSDSFDRLIQLATDMIKQGMIYADDTPVEEMRQQRMDGIESKCRNQKVEDTLKIWSQMQKGETGSEAYCLRIKLDMKAANKALRDPVVYRANKTSHWKTGTKFKVYPTYDFACPFVDSFEGVTHAMRSSEYKDREAQYKWILKEMQKVDPSLPVVEIIEFSRLNLIYTVLSKRKLQWFVDTGRVEGWNDPRFPTVQGIIRRGLTLEGLKEYILSQGASKNITFQEWDKLWTINKRVIDPVVPRHTAVESSGYVVVDLDEPSSPEIVTVPKYPL